ncbi:MAG: ABC transporter permease [Armatimonadetes bacterium]|nr:MAG: ABC transporter permease [Armatimonadota bacterium]
MTLVAQTSNQPLIVWDWIGRNLANIWDRTVEHIVLTVIAVGIGIVVSVVLSLIALRWRRSYPPITWITGLLYTIPSLALFTFLVPFTGLSLLTAEIGLVSYTLLILVRTMVTGIDEVPPAVLEAADAMGYSRRDRFLRIEVPLALPVIITGVRLATVTIIGLVTVTSLIGLGGLGYFILRGLQTFSSPIGTTQIFVGTALSIVLAVSADLSLVGVERILTPWREKRIG